MNDAIPPPASPPAAEDAAAAAALSVLDPALDPSSPSSLSPSLSSPSKASPPDAPPLDARALADHTLHFLATASNETLAACLLALAAATYLILGRLGLLLIGIVAGVALHATWERQSPHAPGHAAPGTRELGAHVAQRVLDWRDARAHDAGKSEHGADLHVSLYAGKTLDFSAFQPETAAALTELTDAVVRDYVRWWYTPVLPTDNAFPDACRQTLTAFLISVSTHLSRKRPADTFVDFVTRSSSFVMIVLQELGNALQAAPGDTPADAIDLYLRTKTDSTLANILDPAYQRRQFSIAAEDILQNYLEPKTYNCMPAKTFLHQILANVVLEMIVASCSKSEWINGWIVQLLEDGEPELMTAIDAGVEASQVNPPERREHKRVVSRAQDAMDEALQEAQRLSQMIAEEDAKRLKNLDQSASISSLDDREIVTPTSSQSETTDGYTDLGISGISSRPESQIEPSPPKAESPVKAERVEEPKHEPKKSFTSFDQLVPNHPPTALQDNPPPVEKPPPLTLHNCTLSIFDDSMPGDKGVMKSKPNVEYLIQIEPASQYHSGWMTARKYTEFETLHEVIRRIAAITGTTGFVEAHATLPGWKGHTKPSLRGELERYLNDAVKFKPLAESEGMRRFLEKELGSGKTPSGFPGIGWAGQTFDTMGKGMLDVLTKAPKEVAGGGKALFGGVTGVLGSVATPLGGRKNRDSISNATSIRSASPSGSINTSSPARASTTPSQATQTRHSRAESTVSELPTHIRSESSLSLATKRTSTDSLRNANSPIIDQQPAREAQMERRPSYNPDGDGKRSGHGSRYGSRSGSLAPSRSESVDLSPLLGGDQILNLPPMPSEITDDYSTAAGERASLDPQHARSTSRASLPSQSSQLSTTPQPVPVPVPAPAPAPAPTPAATATSALANPPSTYPLHAPLSDPETSILVDLLFGATTSLYSLSSAWTLRRTLLNAAKTYLLRPGNPQLTSITTLFQSALDTHTSDPGIAAALKAMRANALPTPTELDAWPAELDQLAKERLEVRARRCLVDKGMPSALTGVMGQAASSEAMGKVFDALQEPRVARGVIFGLVLQGLRGVTQ